jgi:inhibitor of KinA sporulation pathway (predicted exonuclease)
MSERNIRYSYKSASHGDYDNFSSKSIGQNRGLYDTILSANPLTRPIYSSTYKSNSKYKPHNSILSAIGDHFTSTEHKINDDYNHSKFKLIEQNHEIERLSTQNIRLQKE